LCNVVALPALPSVHDAYGSLRQEKECAFSGSCSGSLADIERYMATVDAEQHTVFSAITRKTEASDR